MDVSAFEAARGEHSPSLSELAALLDEDLRVPVAGVTAIVKHLLRLALLVWSLGACVILYCFVLAWLCLFWAQTRLFKYTSALLDCCMSTAPHNQGPTIGHRSPASSTQKAKVIRTSKITSVGRLPAAVSRSGLAGEGNRNPLLREHLTPARSSNFARETYGSIDSDDDAILQEILQQEEKLEAEIQELTSSFDTERDCNQPRSPIRLTAAARDLGFDRNDHLPDHVDRYTTQALHEQHNLSGDESSIETLAAITHSQQAEHLDVPIGDSHINTEPAQAATFKLIKPKVNSKPRVNHVEQLNERKASELTLFVKSLTSDSINSRREVDSTNGTADAEHLKAVWYRESVVAPARSRPLTAISKTLQFRGPSLATPVSRAFVRRPAHQASGPTPRNEQHSLTVPPHARITPDVKARRVAADQLAYEATVKANAEVLTDNPFAALSDDLFCVDAPGSPQVRGDYLAQLGKCYTSVFPPPTSPSSPAAIDQTSALYDFNQTSPQEETGLHEDPGEAQLEHGFNRADPIDKRRVYTLDALKAAKNDPIQVNEDTFAGRIEAAAELVSSHTLPRHASTSPKKKRALGRWDNFDVTKKHPPANDRNSITAAEQSESVSQSHASSTVLPNRHDSAISITTKANSIGEAVETFTTDTFDPISTIKVAPSTSSDLEPSGLEFSDPSSFDQPAPKSIPVGKPRSLPITPGPLSFFAPKGVANENVTTQHATTSGLVATQEPIASNPFTPAPFPSSLYHTGQALQPLQSQLLLRADPSWYEGQDYLHMSQQMTPQVTPFVPMASNYGYNAVAFNNRRQSLAAPISAPSFDLSSEEAFPALDAAKSTRNNISIPEPPVLSVARSDTQAEFDAHLPTFETPPERALHLGKFISTATTSSASLDRTHGQAVGEAVLTVPAVTTQSSLLPVTRKELPEVMESPHTGYDATFPELPKVTSPEAQLDREPGDKSMKREKRKLARDSLKDSWFDREEARKRLVASFSLEGANDLKQKTLSYLKKRSTLQSLMSSGTLNQQDAAMFPEFGLLDLNPPKVKATGVEEWQSRKRESKAAIAKVAAATPVAPAEQIDSIDGIIKDLIVAVDHRERSRSQMKMPRPQGAMTQSTWVTTCEQTCARADKLYLRKRKTLVAAYPEGLPKDLEMRFPDI